MKFIPLTLGKTAIVDDEDFERISLHRWAFNSQGGYAVRKGCKRKGEPRTVQMHREILHAPKGCQIDHINGNGLDNRKANLRIADVQRNAFNRGKPNVPCSSQYKGVFRRKNKPSWYARIKYCDRHVELGAYSSEALAAAIYNYAARIFFGEFRRENSSDEIPVLSVEDKQKVFKKCQRAAESHGWYINTDEYRLFDSREVA